MLGELLNLLGMMFLLALFGFVAAKRGLVGAQGKKELANLILYLILPCNILKAFCEDMSAQLLGTAMQMLLIACGVQLLCMAVSRLFYNRMREGGKQVYQYATVCANAGFMGNPLAERVFGSTGLVYACVFLIPQRIVMWTAGVALFTRLEEKDKKAARKKVLLHPCMIAMYLGLLLFISGCRLPQMISEAVASCGGCCMGMTVMYIGMVLSDVEWKTVCSVHQIYFALIRLIGLPAVVYAACLLGRADPLVTGVSVLLTATPAGSTTAILAARYGADEESAAKCVAFTTLLSVMTIPVWSMLLLRGITG